MIEPFAQKGQREAPRRSDLLQNGAKPFESVLRKPEGLCGTLPAAPGISNRRNEALKRSNPLPHRFISKKFGAKIPGGASPEDENGAMFGILKRMDLIRSKLGTNRSDAPFDEAIQDKNGALKIKSEQTRGKAERSGLKRSEGIFF